MNNNSALSTQHSQLKIHFLGIGGTGVSQLANFFIKLTPCYNLTGSNIEKNERTEILKDKVKISIPHNDKIISTKTILVIYSPAIPENNEEFVKAKNLKTPIVEFTNVLRLLADLYFHKKEPDIKEYDCTKNEILFLKKLFRQWDNDEILNAIKESNILPLFDIDYSKEKYIAVTGTDGKTTTSNMIYHILKEAGNKVGLISTINAKIGYKNTEKSFDTGLHTTTPAPEQLKDMILKLKKENCTHIIIEVTSHGIAMQRVTGLKFDSVIFTNITKEHLDYHKTWENYAFTKTRLITSHLKPNATIIYNHDNSDSDKYISQVINQKEVNFITYCHCDDNDKADITAQIAHRENAFEIPLTINISKELRTHLPIRQAKNSELRTKLIMIGEYNVQNFLGALGAIVSLNEDIVKAIKSIQYFPQLKGRMNIIQKKPFMIIVDFAHTPNALEQALKSLNSLPHNKIHVVFGCAGLRDRYKRPAMGKIADDYADNIYLTAEDPRTEKLIDINKAILEGMSGYEEQEKINKNCTLYKTNKNKTVYSFTEDSVKSREDAIRKAIENAKEGDIIISTGKGHEQSLCFGRTEYHWDDTNAIERIIK
ncbi:MAG TPA: UDP-N-acetylmuramyl-tripeptide synthetase [Candidatus Dojkabacteria bacterium]|nr:UDP-N-acetylmuramyl-tripeptide synthetase [Candidatus Dojkabacteria bacterium]HQF36845.1 UDP-N-acetylmuramyl-tripeptide synthetase [Candidatus Dojkabacteria bacterium]